MCGSQKWPAAALPPFAIECAFAEATSFDHRANASNIRRPSTAASSANWWKPTLDQTSLDWFQLPSLIIVKLDHDFFTFLCHSGDLETSGHPPGSTSSHPLIHSSFHSDHQRNTTLLLILLLYYFATYFTTLLFNLLLCYFFLLLCYLFYYFTTLLFILLLCYLIYYFATFFYYFAIYFITLLLCYLIYYFATYFTSLQRKIYSPTSLTAR